MGRTNAGYLAVSHPAWCDRIREKKPHRCAFWRRATTRFRVLDAGDPFFFLRKQEQSRPIGERSVIGYAEYRLSEVQPLAELAGYYGLHELGVSSPAELERRLVEIAWDGSTRLPHLVGVILLGQMQEFRYPVAWDELASLGIGFAPNVVQGIGLTASQVESLLDAGLYGHAS
jgi:hypothetical protein